MVLTADKREITDGSLANLAQRINSPIPIVIVSRPNGFVFNDGLLNLKDYILLDACELGWDYNWQRGTHFFGWDEDKREDLFGGEEWKMFDDFISARPPKIRFVRELRQEDSTYSNVFPIEYPALFNADKQSREEFYSRPIEVFFNWGLSNPRRPELHGEIWSYMNRLGYIVCDNFHLIGGFIKHENNSRKWLTVNTPHYARQPIETVLQINSLSKLSISLSGAGKKCFRMAEASLNAVMIMEEDNMKYTFDWVDGVNCIKLKKDVPYIDQINEATKRNDLYEIYEMGIENCRKYFIDNYVAHINKIIQTNL